MKEQSSPGQGPFDNYLSIILKIVLIVAFFEYTIMYLIHSLKLEERYHPLLVAAFDTLAMSLVLVVSIIYFVIRPSMVMKKFRAVENKLMETGKVLENLMNSSPVGIISIDMHGNITMWNPASERMFGFSAEEAMGRPVMTVPPERTDEFKWIMDRTMEGESIVNINTRRMRKDGSVVDVSISTSPLKDSQGNITGAMALFVDITQQKEMEDALRQSEQAYRTLAYNLPGIVYRVYVRENNRTRFFNKMAEKIIGYADGDLGGGELCPLSPLMLEGDREAVKSEIDKAIGEKRSFGIEYRIRHKNGGILHMLAQGTPVFGLDGFLLYIDGTVFDITERKKMEDRLFEITRDWENTFNSITDMVTIHDREFNIVDANKAATKILGLPFLEPVSGGAEGRKCFRYFHGSDKPPEGYPSCDCLVTGRAAQFEIFEPYLNKYLEVRAMPRYDRENKLAGLIHVVRDITERRKNEESIKRQMEQLTALRSIDMAISSTFDLRVVLKILLEQVVDQLDVDAADILLAGSDMRLKYASGRGFKTTEIEKTSIMIGHGLAGKAAKENKTVFVPDISAGETGLPSVFKEEGFTSYVAIPLVAKGHVKGVMEIFRLAEIKSGPDWVNFLEILAGQAAIAIDNISTYDNLQRSHNELAVAYETTIEGWSRALDYRDKETEGHSLRVTDIAVAVARELGMSDEEIVHVRRGALLHDIGKLGVPDGILLKPGKLTDEEWVIMRRHPVIAYELLSPIGFLRQSVDIPYCHHENWDGTGYPRGLKGEQIPLSARIFAIVDVWDALLSERPYRPPWPVDKTRDYIASLSGKQFDPKVVEAFFKCVKKNI